MTSSRSRRSPRAAVLVVMALVVALGTLLPAGPASAGRPSPLATVISPEQALDVQFHDGGSAPGTFRSSLEVYKNNVARGRARLTYAESLAGGTQLTTLDLSYVRGRITSLDGVTLVTFVAAGRQCVSPGGTCVDVRVTGSVHPEPSSPDCLIYDVLGPLVRDATVDATGTFVLG